MPTTSQMRRDGSIPLPAQQLGCHALWPKDVLCNVLLGPNTGKHLYAQQATGAVTCSPGNAYALLKSQVMHSSPPTEAAYSKELRLIGQVVQPCCSPSQIVQIVCRGVHISLLDGVAVLALVGCGKPAGAAAQCGCRAAAQRETWQQPAPAADIQRLRMLHCCPGAGQGSFVPELFCGCTATQTDLCSLQTVASGLAVGVTPNWARQYSRIQIPCVGLQACRVGRI